MLIGYMRVSKADGHKQLTYSAMRCWLQVSIPPISTKIRLPENEKTAQDWQPV